MLLNYPHHQVVCYRKLNKLAKVRPNMKEILRKIGLTQNESKAYEALLKIGEWTVSDILEESELTSGKIYETLSSLEKRGLISIVIKSGVKHFSPANPNKLLSYLEDKKAEIDIQKREFEKLLPSIMDKINKSKGESKIEIFSGFNGMKTAQMKEFDYAKKSSTLYVTGVLASEKYPKGISDFFIYNIKPLRESKKYQIKKLLGDDARGSKKDQEKQATIKYLPYDSQVGIIVIENLTLLGIYTENPIVIVIDSEEIAKSFREQFNVLWKQAKK